VIQATFSIPFESVDQVDEFLLELGDPRWMVVQDLPSKSAHVEGIFDSEAEAGAAWAELTAQASTPSAIGELSLRVLADQDWRDSYKAHFKAWKFGRLHWVPVWEKATYVLPEGDVVIWLDPGLAFGTGNHETTRLCCERLVALAGAVAPSARVIDAGCGSGILALSAAKLGFQRVRGFDNDEEAIRVSLENAELNGLSGVVPFETADLTTGWHGERAEVVLANIQADVLMRFSEPLIEAVAPGGALVLSGILSREIEQVRGHFAARTPGWSAESRTLGEWSDLLLVRR
jgi:ribosomal protein L11 methyltransferase